MWSSPSRNTTYWTWAIDATSNWCTWLPPGAWITSHQSVSSTKSKRTTQLFRTSTTKFPSYTKTLSTRGSSTVACSLQNKTKHLWWWETGFQRNWASKAWKWKTSTSLVLRTWLNSDLKAMSKKNSNLQKLNNKTWRTMKNSSKSTSLKTTSIKLLRRWNKTTWWRTQGTT